MKNLLKLLAGLAFLAGLVVVILKLVEKLCPKACDVEEDIDELTVV